jgi:hypothetical protein
VLFALALLDVFFVPSMGAAEHQENLSNVCDRLEALERTRSFRAGVDECRQIGDHDSVTVSAEVNPFVQERYLADRANLLLAYADIQKSPDDKKALAVEALRGWIDYFSWFNELSGSTQAAVVQSYRPKLYAAAAGLGIAAIDAEDPKSAWSQYEQLKDVFFNRKAIRLWLAALLYPKHPVPIDDLIFAKTASDSTLLKQLAQSDRAEHSRNFYERMQKLDAAKHGADDLVAKLRLLFSSKHGSGR